MTFKELWNKLPEDCRDDSFGVRTAILRINENDSWEITEDESGMYESTFWEGNSYHDTESHDDFQSAVARVTSKLNEVKSQVEQSLKYLED